jgi:DtxR family Mn-dependent transcriptional regulator
MVSHKMSGSPISENIEMYLVRVAQLRQHGQPVPLSQLAHELSITPVSANEMCRKLTDKGLVEYEPYKGVTLTADGERLAQQVLRSRHLWATFFVEKLGLEPTAADEIACRFEHVTPDDLADRLAIFLDNSEPGSASYGRQACLLTNLTAGKRGRVIDLTAGEMIKDFLNQQGIEPGKTVTVLGVAADGSLLVEVSGQPLSLSHVVAQTIKVTLALEPASGNQEASQIIVEVA